MNTIRLLSAQPWVERLGAALLHFLWQGLAIALAYAIARRFTRGPNARYLLACAALALMTAAPVVTWSLAGAPPPGAAAPPPRVSASGATPAPVRGVTPLFAAPDYRAVSEPLLPWVVAVWLAGALAFWLRLVSGWVLAERLRSRRVRPAPPEWQQTLERLKRTLAISRPVRLLVSALAQTPAVVGWLRPVVLVPVGALAGLPAEQVEALLLHELAHIRRHDFAVNVLQSAVEALLFYHPAVWWISGHIRAERELCCDDVAVSVTGDTGTYVRALAELEMERAIRLRAALAANGGSVADRMARLLGQSRPASRSFSTQGLAAAAILPAIAVLAVFAQPAARPSFAAASIKPGTGRGLQAVRPLAGRLTADATVRTLMQNAYAVQAYQIEGGADWIGSERYAVEAKAEGKASRAELFQMLQSLLEERFQLKIHRETRELPVYALLAAGKGPKLPAPKEGECAEPSEDAPPEWNGGRMAPPGSVPLGLPPCGRASVALYPDSARLQGGNLTMAELTRALSLVMGRGVIDRTGFKARFDVRLDFLGDESTPSMPPPPPDAVASAQSKAASIQTALREQLGLRLETTRGPVEVIVIDHVERPTAN